MIQRNNKNIRHIYKGEAPILPDEYQEVEYITGYGEQYINTGIVSNANIAFTIKEKSEQTPYNGNASTRCIIGGRTDVNNGISIWDNAGYFQYGKSSGIITKLAAALSDTDVHIIEVAQDVKVYVDGEIQLSSYVKGTSYPAGSYIYLFTCLSAEGGNTRTTDMTDKRTFCGNIYYCIIKDNGVTVRHLIPCYRKSDNKPGMYDIVNKVFYTNAGTGEFTVGSDVAYKKIRSITYKGQVIFTDNT